MTENIVCAIMTDFAAVSGGAEAASTLMLGIMVAQRHPEWAAAFLHDFASLMPPGFIDERNKVADWLPEDYPIGRFVDA